MKGLESADRKVLEILKETEKVKLTFPVGDGVCDEMEVTVRDRTAIHQIALVLENYLLRCQSDASGTRA